MVAEAVREWLVDNNVAGQVFFIDYSTLFCPDAL